MAGRYLTINDLPATLGIFPLTGVLLLPRGQLPLNVFEPRYLAMVDTALSGNRLIGMIQPVEREEITLKPPLSAVGCAGRIVAYRETDDGRYLITLSGISRFAIGNELEVTTAFRQVKADFAPYASDLAESEDSDFPRERLLGALKAYLSQR